MRTATILKSVLFSMSILLGSVLFVTAQELSFNRLELDDHLLDSDPYNEVAWVEDLNNEGHALIEFRHSNPDFGNWSTLSLWRPETSTLIDITLPPTCSSGTGVLNDSDQVLLEA